MKKRSNWVRTAAVLFTVVMILSLCLGGCGSSGASSEEASAKDSVVLNLWSEPDALCGAFTTRVYSALVSKQIFDTLVIERADGTIEPDLATEWEVADDGTEIVFTLRDDVVFQNGEKMTADDVVFSYNTTIAAGYAESMTNNMEKMEKIDDTHVKLTFKTAYGPAIQVCASYPMVIYPQKAYEEDPDGFNRNPIGTGPYKFVSWATGESIELEANEDYFEGVPSIKNVTFKIFTDNETSSLALQNGEIDACINPPSTDMERLKNDENISYLTSPECSVYFLFFNHDSIFSDERLRLAVAYALNKDEVLQGAAEGNGKVVSTIYPDFLFGVDKEYEAPTNDPEKAKQLLAEAGYADGLDINVVTSSDPRWYKALEIVQAQLAEVGINMTIEKYEPTAWQSDIFETGDYTMNSMMCEMWLNDFDDLYALYRGGEMLNYGNLNDEELNEQYDIQHTTANAEIREEACNNVCRIMGDKALNIPIYESNSVIAVNKNLSGVSAAAQIWEYYIKDWSWAEENADA